MGYSVDHLEIIKNKFVQSEPVEVKALFEYIEEQLYLMSTSEGSLFTLTLQDVQKAKSDLSSVSLENIEVILNFALEQLPLNRLADKAGLLVGLDKVEFYTRELRYSKIERFIFNLTSI